MFLSTLSSSWTSFAMSSSGNTGTASWTLLWFNSPGYYAWPSLDIVIDSHCWSASSRGHQMSTTLNETELYTALFCSFQKTNYAAMSPWLPPSCCLCRVYPPSSFLRMTVRFTGLPWSLTIFLNISSVWAPVRLSIFSFSVESNGLLLCYDESIEMFQSPDNLGDHSFSNRSKWPDCFQSIVYQPIINCTVILEI